MGYQPISTMGKAIRELPEDKRAELRELSELLNQMGTEDPPPGKILDLRRLFEDYPALPREAADFAELATENLLNRELAPTYTAEIARAQVKQMKRRMGHGQCPPIEDLLIDNVALCWLRLHILEYRYTDLRSDQSFTIDQAEWLEKRLDAAQRRFLRATQALARVRKLTRDTIALQVNIADKQVNLFGNEDLPWPAE